MRCPPPAPASSPGPICLQPQRPQPGVLCRAVDGCPLPDKVSNPDHDLLMIVVYHHVCPLDQIPAQQTALEGWRYNIVPTDFELQLHDLQQRGFRMVSMEEYLRFDDPLNLLLTFDDGWSDNFSYALPILQRCQVPAVFFVVSQPLEGLDPRRQMSPAQLRELARSGFTVGAHSRTHPNLDELPLEVAREELAGSRRELQEYTQQPINYFAYPRGRFNRALVDLAKELGFSAACSAMGWGANCPASRFWLYRDLLAPRPGGLANYLRIHPVCRRLMWFRNRIKVRQMLRRG